MRRQILSVAIITGIVQVASFLKLWLIARYFGVSAELDGYNLALVLPLLVTGVLGGALQTGYFPVYAELRTHRDLRSLGAFEARIFWVLLGLSIALALLLYGCAHLIAWRLARNSSTAVVQATEFVLGYGAFSLVLSAMAEYLGYLLAVRGYYLVAAAAPIANTLLGAALLAVWPEGGLLNLTVGLLLGGLIQLAIVYKAARNAGFDPLLASARVASLYRPTMEMTRLGLWVLPGVLFANLANAAPPVLIASFGEGAVSAFGYAFRFHQSAVQLLVMAASPIILTRFSQLVAEGALDRVDRLQRKAMLWSLVLGVLAVVLVASCGELFLRFVMVYGRFDESAAARVAMHWLYLTVGFGFAVYGNILAKRVQAEKAAKLLPFFALMGLIALWLCWRFTRDVLGEHSVPLSLTVMVITTCGAMVLFFRQRFRMRAKSRTVAVKASEGTG